MRWPKNRLVWKRVGLEEEPFQRRCVAFWAQQHLHVVVAFAATLAYLVPRQRRRGAWKDCLVIERHDLQWNLTQEHSGAYVFDGVCLEDMNV